MKAFLSRYSYKIDRKGRVSVPAEYRSTLAELGSDGILAFPSLTDRAIRCAHENPEVIRLYDEFLGAPLGAKAHELLHTRYHARPLYRR